MRRSVALQRIMHLQRLWLLRLEEFARFSKETRNTLQLLLERPLPSVPRGAESGWLSWG